MLDGWMAGARTPLPQVELERGSGFVPKDSRNKAALPKPKYSPGGIRNIQDPTGQYMWLFSGSK